MALSRGTCPMSSQHGAQTESCFLQLAVLRYTIARSWTTLLKPAHSCLSSQLGGAQLVIWASVKPCSTVRIHSAARTTESPLVPLEVTVATERQHSTTSVSFISGHVAEDGIRGGG